MSYEWLFIGFFIVFGFGWLAGRLDIRHIRKSAAELPDAFLLGLSYLLTKNEEKALDAFLSAPQTGTTPEAFQFAVGELLRQRGEHKRALQIHRQLYKQENLPITVRHRALWALAEDYHRMGFVDLAEQHAKPLLEVADYTDQTFALLLNIYQQKRQYQEALALVESLGEEAITLNRNLIAQWYCQFALAQPDNAKALLETALEKNPDCVQASLLLAKSALTNTPPDTATAIRHLTAIEQQNAEHLWLAADSLIHAYEAQGDTQSGLNTIRRWLNDYPSPMLLAKVCAILKDDSLTLTEHYLITHGDTQIAAKWIAAQKDTSPAWQAIHAILRHNAGKPFTCHRCNYSVNNFSWQCRSCLAWESLKQR